MKSVTRRNKLDAVCLARFSLHRLCLPMLSCATVQLHDTCAWDWPWYPFAGPLANIKYVNKTRGWACGCSPPCCKIREKNGGSVPVRADSPNRNSRGGPRARSREVGRRVAARGAKPVSTLGSPHPDTRGGQAPREVGERGPAARDPIRSAPGDRRAAPAKVCHHPRGLRRRRSLC